MDASTIGGAVRFGLAVFVAVPAVGAVLGALGFGIFGLLVQDPERVASILLKQGLRDGGFFGLVWAPGLAVVLAVRQHVECRRRRESGGV